MRFRLAMKVAGAGLLFGFAAMGSEPEAPGLDGESVEGILAEPVDPDEAADIRADDDPNDVGQEGLDPSEGATPGPEQPAPPDRALPGVAPNTD